MDMQTFICINPSRPSKMLNTISASIFNKSKEWLADWTGHFVIRYLQYFNSPIAVSSSTLSVLDVMQHLLFRRAWCMSIWLARWSHFKLENEPLSSLIVCISRIVQICKSVCQILMRLFSDSCFQLCCFHAPGPCAWLYFTLFGNIQNLIIAFGFLSSCLASEQHR